MTHSNNKASIPIFQDVGIIVLSFLIAIILVQTDVLGRVLTATKGLELLGSFIAGVFFTSVFTTAPAIATLGDIAATSSIWTTALFGALGAVVGDLLIFQFFRDRFSEHIVEILTHKKGSVRRIHALVRLKAFRWLTFLIGGLIIASPIPDEVGITLLGFSKMKSSWFVVLSFVFNFIGIVVIGFAFKKAGL